MHFLIKWLEQHNIASIVTRDLLLFCFQYFVFLICSYTQVGYFSLPPVSPDSWTADRLRDRIILEAYRTAQKSLLVQTGDMAAEHLQGLRHIFAEMISERKDFFSVG